MYIVNVDQLPLNKEDVYQCGALIANYLVYECHIPMLGKNEEGRYCFTNNEHLQKALDSMPFWYKVRDLF